MTNQENRNVTRYGISELRHVLRWYAICRSRHDRYSGSSFSTFGGGEGSPLYRLPGSTESGSVSHRVEVTSTKHRNAYWKKPLMYSEMSVVVLSKAELSLGCIASVSVVSQLALVLCKERPCYFCSWGGWVYIWEYWHWSGSPTLWPSPWIMPVPSLFVQWYLALYLPDAHFILTILLAVNIPRDFCWSFDMLGLEKPYFKCFRFLVIETYVNRRLRTFTISNK